MQSHTDNYQLLDSGDGERLERFADVVLIRPSKLSIWRRRSKVTEWKSADASFEHKSGWRCHGKSIKEWELECAGAKLKLRLQENGQIGFFPEHLSYCSALLQTVKDLRGDSNAKVQVLNLFAYTGLASILAAQCGAEVTHLDLSKRALEWARENFAASNVSDIRLIQEDALKYLEREVRRGKKYQIVLADPPSFSRVSAKQEWTLEQVMARLIELMGQVLAPAGVIFLSSHHYESGGHVMANLVHDYLPTIQKVSVSDLLIPEAHSKRKLPAGFLVFAQC